MVVKLATYDDYKYIHVQYILSPFPFDQHRHSGGPDYRYITFLNDNSIVYPPAFWPDQTILLQFSNSPILQFSNPPHLHGKRLTTTTTKQQTCLCPRPPKFFGFRKIPIPVNKKLIAIVISTSSENTGRQYYFQYRTYYCTKYVPYKRWYGIKLPTKFKISMFLPC